MKKDLKEVFDIKKGDIVSITGSGGKTSIMFALSEYMKDFGKTLITTSTKIIRPDSNKYIVYDSFSSYKKTNDKLVVIGEKLEVKNKLSSIDIKELESLRKDFDYIFIEADGCRNLPLKMWKKTEPVIYPFTTKTITVFPIKILGINISEDYIYNFEEFKEYIKEEKITKEVILKLLSLGAFRNFNGEKIVFINQVDSKEEEEMALDLLKYLDENTKNIKFIYGSVKEGFYENYSDYHGGRTI